MNGLFLRQKQKFMTGKTLKRQQGTTLIEVVVSVFVLSFGVLALMLAQLNAVNTSINSANQAEVTRAVQNYIEVLRAQPKIAAESYVINKNKVAVLKRDYSGYATNDCTGVLGLKLINTSVKSCTIDGSGLITVAWDGESLGNNDENSDAFTYSLSVNDNLPGNGSPGNDS